MHLSVRHHFDETRTADEVVKTLLQDRVQSDLTQGDKVDCKSQIADFLHPPHPTFLTLTDFGFAQDYIDEAFTYIFSLHPHSSPPAAHRSKSIVVYSDYDADGVTGGAILWETLHKLGFKVHPYIGDRVTEGYGMSKKGVDIIKEKYDPALIITVDHGISAREQVAYARTLGIDVIVTDHHHRSEEKVPTDARAIFHIPSLSGSSTAYYVAKEICEKYQVSNSNPPRHGGADQVPNNTQDPIAVPELVARSLQLSEMFSSDYVGLAAIGTIADLVPLTGASRAVAYHGLKALSTSIRPGIKALKASSGNLGKTITTYEVGYMLAPRINAAGRLESALDALRLLCTTNQSRADELAAKCEVLNTQRQDMVKQATAEAIRIVEQMRDDSGTLPHILIVHQPSGTAAPWHEGIIGLIASKLLEKYYRPVIVCTPNESGYKASARSVSDFHITDFLSEFKHLLISSGGHAAAAGLSVSRESFALFVREATAKAQTYITPSQLEKVLYVDIRIPLSLATEPALSHAIQSLEPFGIGNPKPLFVSTAMIHDVRPLGKEGNHLKLILRDIRSDHTSSMLNGILFSKAKEYSWITPEMTRDIVYTLDWNEWQGRKTIQAKITQVTQVHAV